MCQVPPSPRTIPDMLRAKCSMLNAVFEKQTQSPNSPNRHNPFTRKGLQQNSTPAEPKKQTQNKPNLPTLSIIHNSPLEIHNSPSPLTHPPEPCNLSRITPLGTEVAIAENRKDVRCSQR